MASIDKNFVVKLGLTVGTTEITAATGDITVLNGNISAGTTRINGSTGTISVGGLTINGTTGTINTAGSITVEDTVTVGSTILTNAAGGSATIANAIITSGQITGTPISGASGDFTDFTASNINITGGNISTTTMNQCHGSFSALTTGNISVTGGSINNTSIHVSDLTATGGNIDGVRIGGTTPVAGSFSTVSASSGIAGVLATTAQPNITSVGTLSSLIVETGITAGSLSGNHIGSGQYLTSIPNSALVNSAITIGATTFSLGDSKTIVNGLTSITSDVFNGPLNGVAANITGQANSATIAASTEATANQLVLRDASSNFTSNIITAVTFVGNVNASTVAGTLTTSYQPNITSVGVLTSFQASGTATFGNIVAGNIIVGGNLITVDSSTLTTANLTITLAQNAVSPETANGAGIIVAGANASILYSSATNSFVSNVRMDATSFYGSGIGLTNIPNSALTNNSFVLGSTSIELGTTALNVSGLTSLSSALVTSSSFVGPLTGLASTATLATKASTLSQGGANGTAMTFNYSAQAGTPTYVWGTNDGVTTNTWSPANFSVNYATTAGGMSTFTSTVARTDTNNYNQAARTQGIYAISGAGTNGPGPTYLNLIHCANSTDVGFQIAGGYTSDALYFRGTSALHSGTGYSAWRSVVHSGNVGAQSVNFANTATSSSQVTITYNVDTNATYQMLWGDGTNVKGTAGIYCNPSTDHLYAAVFEGTATSALYADLAENYTSDENYEPGTVVSFGGEAEVTISKVSGCRKVAGVVSTNPAYLMNSGLAGTKVTVALQGRCPVKVIGKIEKGDMLVSAGNGCARASDNPLLGQVIGKALEDFSGAEDGIIEVAIGRT